MDIFQLLGLIILIGFGLAIGWFILNLLLGVFIYAVAGIFAFFAWVFQKVKGE